MVPARPAGGFPSLEELAVELFDRARTEGVTLLDPGGLLGGLTNTLLETTLEAELAEHLGYNPYDLAGYLSGNSRNGTCSKTVLTEVGAVTLDVPRDRAGTFEPAIVPKRRRRLTGNDPLVCSLSAKGLTHGEISAHLMEIYGAQVSRETVRLITDRLLEAMTDWQNRPLDAITSQRDALRAGTLHQQLSPLTHLRPVKRNRTPTLRRNQSRPVISSRFSHRHRSLLAPTSRSRTLRSRCYTKVLAELVEALHQRGDEQQPGLGRETRLVEGHRDATDTAQYWPRRNCLLDPAGNGVFTNAILPGQKAPPADVRWFRHGVTRWIGAEWHVNVGCRLLVRMPAPMPQSTDAVPPFTEAATAGELGRSRLILLGSGGGPTIHMNPTRMGPANVIIVDGIPYLIDCGEGVSRQFVRAGLSFTDVDNVFITHQHFDHNSDLGNFLAYAWFAGRRTPIVVTGPPRLAGLLDDFVRLNKFDFRLREAETGRPPFDPIPHAKEISIEGRIEHEAVEVLVDERVSVSAIRVNHGLIPSVAYRFKTPDRDIVFSGDRGGQDDIASFASGADVLVHEVLHYEAMVETYPNASEVVLAHYRQDHTAPEDVGRVAAEAGVKTVVLNHVLPDGDVVDDAEWLRLVAKTFDGEILLGTDLLEV